MKRIDKARQFVFFATLLIFAFTFCGTLFAQHGYRSGNLNPETGRYEGFLPWETYGRFGWQSVRGPMIRNYPHSRFSMNGAAYDERGRWIGTSPNPATSRFKNYGIESYLENEMYRENMSRQQPSAPIPVAPTEQSLSAEAAARLTADQVIPRYVPTPQPHNLLAEITLSEAAAHAQTQSPQPQLQPQSEAQQQLQRQPPQGQGSGPNRQSQWFRGGVSRSAQQPPQFGPARTTTIHPQTAGAPGVSGIRHVGSDPQPSIMPVPTPPPLVELPLTPEQTAALQRQAQQRIDKSLEEMILRSPDVHLLSPVTVKLVNGVATISGLVAKQDNKVKAGEILLAAPGVQQVQNLLSTLEDEE